MSYFEFCMLNFRKQTNFFKDASTGEAHKYETYLQMLCNQNDGQQTGQSQGQQQRQFGNHREIW